MSASGRLIRATGLVTVLVYACLPVVAIAGLCIDRPHTHGGIAAPDCAMHHRTADGPDTGHHGRAHGGTEEGLPPSETRIGCACASDLLPLVMTDAAPPPDGSDAVDPSRAPAVARRARESVIGLGIAPIPPPPRPTRS